MYKNKGRTSMKGYVGGGYYTIKRPVYSGKKVDGVGTQLLLAIPKDWLNTVGNKRVLYYFLMDIVENNLIITPHFDSNAYTDGNFHIAKKPLYFNKSGFGGTKGTVYVTIPSEWKLYINRDNPITYLLLDMRMDRIAVKPHYEKIADFEVERIIT